MIPGLDDRCHDGDFEVIGTGDRGVRVEDSDRQGVVIVLGGSLRDGEGGVAVEKAVEIIIDDLGLADFFEVGSWHTGVDAADRVLKCDVSEVPVGNVVSLDNDNVLLVAKRFDFAELTVVSGGT